MPTKRRSKHKHKSKAASQAGDGVLRIDLSGEFGRLVVENLVDILEQDGWVATRVNDNKDEEKDISPLIYRSDDAGSNCDVEKK